MMIAASQNLVSQNLASQNLATQNLALGVPIAPAGAGVLPAENAGAAENAFLQTFAVIDAEAAMANAPDQDPESKAATTEQDDKTSLETAGGSFAIWQPFAQLKATPLMPAPADLSAKSGLLAATALQVRKEPEGAQVPMAAVASAAGRKDTPWAQDVGDAGKVALPPPAAEPDAELVPTPADQARSPNHSSHSSSNLKSDPDLPADIARPASNASILENVWRQRWVGDIAPDDGDAAPMNATSPDTTDALIHATPAAARAISQSTAAQTAPDLGDAAINPVTDTTPGTLPEVPSLDGSGFGAAAPVAFADGSPGLSPLAPGSSPLAPTTGTPATIAPTIIDMTKIGNDGPVELTLSPEELGRLTISLKRDGDFVHVTLIADRPETLDLMRRHASDLVADLRQAGFSGASLNFGQGGKEQQTRSPETAQGTNTASSPRTPPPETILPIPDRSQIGSGVDLRF